MARARYSNNAATYSGLPLLRIPNATITLYYPGTTTPYADTIAKHATGFETYTNPFQTDEAGNIEFYLEFPTDIKLKIEGVNVPAFYVDFEPVFPLISDIITQKSGVYYLQSFANGVIIDQGIFSAMDAIQAAFDQIAIDTIGDRKGGTLIVGPGTFSITGVNIPPFVTIKGSGKSTIFKKEPNSNVPMFDLTEEGVGLLDCQLDCSYSDNNDDTTGYTGMEVNTLGGSKYLIQNVHAFDFNFIAYAVDGTDATWNNVTFEGVGLNTYKMSGNSPSIVDGYGNPISLTPNVNDVGSLYGFWCYLSFTPPLTDTFNVKMINCGGRKARSASMLGNADGLHITNYSAEDNHRGPYPGATGDALQVPGGQVSFAGKHLQIDSMQLGGPGAGAGAYCSGLELQCTDVQITNLSIRDQSLWGVSVFLCDRIQINNLVTDNCGLDGLRVESSTWVGVNNFYGANCDRSALFYGGSADFGNSDHCTFSNLQGKTNGAGGVVNIFLVPGFIGTDYNIIGEQWSTGEKKGNRLTSPLNIIEDVEAVYAISAKSTATGGSGHASHGAYVEGGLTVFDTLLRINARTDLRLDLSGVGSMYLNTASGSLPLAIARGETSAALLGFIKFVRGASSPDKLYLGLDSSDRFTFLKGDGSASGFWFDPASGNSNLPGTLAVAGAATVGGTLGVIGVLTLLTTLQWSNDGDSDIGATSHRPRHLLLAGGANINTTGALAGEIKTNSHAYIGGREYLSGQTFIYASIAKPNTTVAANSTTTITGGPAGMLLIMDSSSGLSVTFHSQAGFSVYCTGGTLANGFRFGSTSADNSSEVSITASGGTLTIKNAWNTAHDIAVYRVGP